MEGPRVGARQSSHGRREGVYGEKPPSQARGSPPAAGRDGPRGRNLGLATKRPRERELVKGSRSGREGARGEKLPSQARRRQPAAGREGPSGVFLCLFDKAGRQGQGVALSREKRAAVSQPPRAPTLLVGLYSFRAPPPPPHQCDFHRDPAARQAGSRDDQSPRLHLERSTPALQKPA